MWGAAHRFVLVDEEHKTKVTLTNIDLDTALEAACGWLEDEPDTIIMLVENFDEG